jgi:hypothetical protein
MSSIYLGFGVLTPGIVKTSIFWAKPQCSPFKVKGRPRGLQNISMQPVATRFMLPGLFFDHKDGGCMFLQNVVCHSADKCRYLFIPCSSLWSSGRGYRPYKGQVNLLKIHIVVTWVTPPCGMLEGNNSFGETFCPHFLRSTVQYRYKRLRHR